MQQNIQVIWSPHPRQKALIECPLPDIGFGGARGGGKGQPLDALVLTPQGYRRMGDLRLGDVLLNPTGDRQIVTGITELGNRRIYCAVFSDNASCEVTDDHLWLCRETDDRTGEFSSPLLLLTTKEIVQRHRVGYSMHIPSYGVAEPDRTGRTFKAIVKSRVAPARCIKVSHANGLYCTNDRIVTHNSTGLLGHWIVKSQKYGKDAKGLFLRRTFDELEEVQRKALEIFPKLGAQYLAGKRTWIMPSGGSLRMRYLERDKDAEHYQGHEYCVATGTKILMADSTYLPIEQIAVGDFVQTLEGAKRVTRLMQPKRVLCVRADVLDSENQYLGSQVHPLTHPVYTGIDWLTASSAFKGRLRVAIFEQAGICPGLFYVHPYTRQVRPHSSCLRTGTASFSNAGVCEVADLTVEGANHYITECGLINRNSDIYVDEAGNFPSPSPIDLIKGANRSSAGVPCQILLTFNPHGVGHSWIKKRYVDPSPPMVPFYDPEAKGYRVFIPSLLKDNPSLLNSDPDYVNRLHSATLGKPWLLAGWLHGDWDASPEGKLLNPQHFPRYTHLPDDFERIVLSWDTSQKNQAENDPWAMVALGECQSIWYVIEVFCERMNYPEGKRKLRQFALDYCPNAILIEDKSSGSDLIAELRENFWGDGTERQSYLAQTEYGVLPSPPPIFPINPVGSKIDRLCVQSDVIEAGRVLLPAYAPWLNDFLAKVSAYPKVGLDEIDALSQALKWLRSRPRSDGQALSLGTPRAVNRVANRWLST